MEILQVAAGTNATARAHTARVLRAYLDAQHARDSRRVLWGGVAVLAVILVVVEAASGQLTRGSLLALAAMATAVAGSALWREWRATRTLLQLIGPRDADGHGRPPAACDS